MLTSIKGIYNGLRMSIRRNEICSDVITFKDGVQAETRPEKEKSHIEPPKPVKFERSLTNKQILESSAEKKQIVLTSQTVSDDSLMLEKLDNIEKRMEYQQEPPHQLVLDKLARIESRMRSTPEQIAGLGL